MRQVAARRHHNKKRAEGFIPNQHGQDNTNNNTNGDTPVGGNNSSSSLAPTTTTAAPSSSSPAVRTTTTTTTTTTPPAQTTTTSTQPTTTTTTTTTSSALVTTTSTTPIVVANTLSVNQIPTTATNLISHSVASPTIGTATFSSASASATAASSDSSGPQIGPLVGAIGGGLIGVVALAAVAGYFFRRAFRKKDEFDRSEFVRNSVAITDDWNEKPAMGTQNAMALARGNNNMDEPSANPRPPTMIERRGAQQSYGVGEVMNTGYYGQQDQYYNYGNNGYYGHDQYAAGYDQQYAAGDHPYAAGAAYGYTPPNEYQQSQLTRKPSAPLGAARGPGSEYQQQQEGQNNVASPADGNYSTASQYDSRHQSVTPFQQQQYNDINKALNAGAAPTTTAPAGGRELSTAYSTLNQPQQPAQGQQQHAATGAHHPAANNKAHDDEEDAYGGI